MKETSGSESVSTRLQRIAELARRAPGMALTTLAHHIDIDLLHEAQRRVRKDGAAGVDGQTASDYSVNLEANLGSLLERFKSGTYHAPPVRRSISRRAMVARPARLGSRRMRTKYSSVR